MTIKQSSENAMYDWQSFSIGSRAGVRFVMNDANAMALNRVLGNDPSVIMGSLTANGKIFLINAAGILVGKTGKIDVAGFTASTLNISDADFKAGKMNFAADPGKTIGDVQNIGMIKTKSGGSVYLIGANVENDGIITAPNGQVLLAAGSMVKLVDTSLPGVSIEVSGVDGKVTNLGQIIASAGTIGIGAALIDNSGIINASSVEREGGRIFLRATKLLTTDATSQINADGTTGGNVQLYSDQTANIDGDVSALGSAGHGGYVDTSGKTSLSVKYVPRVGPGGTWFIDPHNVTIVTSGADIDTPDGGGVITASGDDSTISASVINNALQNNTSIAISTGTTGSQTGDIVVDTGAFITETESHSATLTLSAAGSITIMGGVSISDGSDSGTPGGLSLVLNAGNAITNNGGIILGGNLTANSASFDNSSMLFLGGGTATFSSDLVNNTNGTIAGVGTVNMTGHTLINNAGTVRPGYGAGTGTLTVIGNYQQNASGTLQSSVGGVTGSIIADQLKVIGNVILDGKLKMIALSGYTPQAGDKASVLNYSGVRTGHFDDSTGIFASNLAVNYLLLDGSTDHNVAVGYVPSGDYYFTGGAGTLDWGTAANWAGSVAPPGSSADVYLDTGTGHSVTHSAVADAIRSLTIATGALDISGGDLTANSIEVDGGQIDVTAGALTASSTLLIGAAGVVNVTGGSLNVTGLTTDSGALNVSGGQLTMDGLGVDGGSTMLISGGSVKAGSTSISGSVTINNTGALEFTSDLSGAGSLIIGGSGHATLDNDTSGVPVAHVTQSGGIFDVKGNFTIGNLTMSGGQINGAVGKSLTVTNSLAQTGGTIGGLGASRIDIGSFTQVAGNLAVGNINANTSLILNALNGAVSQTVGSGIVANALSVNAAQGITLNNGGNNVGTFIANNSQSGDIILNDAAASLSLNGNVTNSHGDVKITNAGNIVSTAVHGDGGNVNGINSSGTVTLTSTNGNVMLGRINAVNLNVSAAQGLINHESTNTGGLTIAGTMTANASSGITLDNTFGTCGSNRIAFFGATNTGSGDITLVNSDSGDVTNRLTKINNLGGNVSVNNNGALETGTDLINASGTVTIATHSPLTIGSGGVTGGSGVTLTAGDGTSATDVLTLNGAVQATTGTVAFGGNTIFENAAVRSLAAPVISSPNPAVQGAGFSQSSPVVQSSSPPDDADAKKQAANDQAKQAGSATTDAIITKTSQTNPVNTITVVTPPAATATNSTSNTASDQTAGGSTGEFGGGDAKDDKKDSNGKSDKPVPNC